MRSATLGVRVTGPLAEFAPGFIEELTRLGYTYLSARNQVRLMGHVSRWLEAQGLVPAEVTPPRLLEFLATRRNAGYTCWLSERGLGPLVNYLVGRKAIPAPEPEVWTSPVDRVLEAYRQYLVAERGVTTTTAADYLAAVRPFLKQRVNGDRLELGELTTADVTGFVLCATERMGIGSAKKLVAALRSLLRYLQVVGEAPDLMAAVPPVAGWRGGQLPRGVGANKVGRLLASCDRTTAVGRRDYAMLMLLARLGLRTCEVAALRLDDFDWQHGEVIIRGKGDRLERLPLPADAGEAVIGYLLDGRPQVEARWLFVGIRAPFGGLSRTAVGHVVGLACDRAGMARVAAHRLRHTLATEMLRAGVALSDVGQILRHRNLSTTAIYAKVDRTALRDLARPWPGGPA